MKYINLEIKLRDKIMIEVLSSETNNIPGSNRYRCPSSPTAHPIIQIYGINILIGSDVPAPQLLTQLSRSTV